VRNDASIEEILPGLYKVKIPLPGIPLPGVNSYIVKGAKRNLIVDPGWNHDECFVAMQHALEELSVDLRKTDFFITHVHLDHVALVLRLKTADSEMYAGQWEAEHVEWDWDGAIAFARAHGFPDHELSILLREHPGYKWTKSRSELRLPFRIVQDKSVITAGKYAFTVIETPGHSKGHLCLYEPEEKVLVSGDHILKEITPTVQLWSEEDNPLLDYIKSLDKIEALDVRQVLPGHGPIFKDCKERIKEMKDHRLERTKEVISLLRQSNRTAYELASRMTWNVRYNSWDAFPVVQKWFSMGETLAHLFYLKEKGYVGKHAGNGHIEFVLNQSQSPVNSL